MADLFDQLADHIVSGSQEKFVAELGAYFEGLLERGCRNPDEFAVLVAQSRSDAMAIWAKWDKRVTEETREAFEAALAEEDGAIVKAFRRAGLKPVRPDMTRRAADYYEQAARGMSEIMRRQNIAMTDLLEEEWYSVTSDAVTAIEGGAPYDEVMEQAVSRLSSRGLQTIDYRSGVSTAVDAAVRRHVVTQANQARNAILTARMDEYDMDLVYTSAHFGARPDHAEWQGKVFSL